MRAVDHYAEAEQLLDSAAQSESDGHQDAAALTLQHAAVHATLALAGATALQAYSTGDEDELLDWQQAAGGDG